MKLNEFFKEGNFDKNNYCWQFLKHWIDKSLGDDFEININQIKDNNDNNIVVLEAECLNLKNYETNPLSFFGDSLRIYTNWNGIEQDLKNKVYSLCATIKLEIIDSRKYNDRNKIFLDLCDIKIDEEYLEIIDSRNSVSAFYEIRKLDYN